MHRKEVRPRIKYHIIYRHRTEYPVAVMCQFFGVSRSGYYAFTHRLGRPEKDAALVQRRGLLLRDLQAFSSSAAACSRRLSR